MFDNGHSPTVPVSAPGRRWAHFVGGPAAKMADFRGCGRLARLVLERGHRGKPPSGRIQMDKFESFAFAIGFIATGLLALVSQVTIV